MLSNFFDLNELRKASIDRSIDQSVSNSELHLCAVIEAIGCIRSCSALRALLAWHRQTVSAQRLRYREACFQYSRELRLQAAVLRQWRRALIQGQQRQCVLESLLIIYQSRVSDPASHRWRSAATAFNNRLLHKVWFRSSIHLIYCIILNLY